MFKTPSQIDALKRKAAPYIKADSKGLVIHVATSGSKTWRLRYPIKIGEETKLKTLTLGEWPHMSIKGARDEADRMRAKLAAGQDPMAVRKGEELAGAVARGRTFSAVFDELILNKEEVKHVAPNTIQQLKDRHRTRVAPVLGDLPIADITAPMLATWARELRRVVPGSARHTSLTVREVFGLAVRRGYIQFNPATELPEEFASLNPTARPALLKPEPFAALMADIASIEDRYNANLLHLHAILYTRPVELMQAPWSEFDLNAGLWVIPAERVKTRMEHVIPLPRQAVAILRELKIAGGGSPWVVPKDRSKMKPSHKDRLNALMRKYLPQYNGVHVPHGFRRTASTMLNEACYNMFIVERSLAHALPTAVAGIYNGAQWVDYQRDMRQAWADALDMMIAGNSEGAASVLRKSAVKLQMAA